MISFYSCNPNLDYGTGFLANTKAALIAYLNANYLLGTLTEDKYTLNYDELRIDEASFSQPSKACYVLWEYGNEKRFYFVENFIVQSGYFHYSLSLDFWATYIYDAAFKSLHITRSTRVSTYCRYPNAYEIDLPSIPLRVYPNLSTDGFDTNGNVTDISKIAVCFFVNFNIKAFLISDQATATLPLAITLKQWQDFLALNNVTLSDADALRSLVNYVANVVNVHLDIPDTPAQEAKVLNAYIVPTSILSISPSQTLEVIMNGIEYYSGLKESISYQAHIVRGTSPLQIPTCAIPLESVVYFGNESNLMPVESVSAPYLSGVDYKKDVAGLRVDPYLKGDELFIRAMQGNHAQDITSMFKVSLLYANADAMALRNLEAVLSNTLAVAGSIVTAIVSEGSAPAIAGVIGATTNGAVSIAETLSQSNKPRAIPCGGDGLTTFLDGSYLQAPLYFTYFTNINLTAIKNAINEEGMITDYEMANAYALASYAKLATLSNSDADYLRGVAKLDGVPVDAMRFICGKISGGVKLIYV